MLHHIDSENQDLTVRLLDPGSLLQSTRKCRVRRYKSQSSEMTNTLHGHGSTSRNPSRALVKKVKYHSEGLCVGKVLGATDFDNTDENSAANNDVDRWVQLSEVKTMIDEALMKSERRRDSQIAEMSEKTIIGAMEMCAVEVQHGTVLSTVSLAILSVVKDVIE